MINALLIDNLILAKLITLIYKHQQLTGSSHERTPHLLFFGKNEDLIHSIVYYFEHSIVLPNFSDLKRNIWRVINLLIFFCCHVYA